MSDEIIEQKAVQQVVKEPIRKPEVLDAIMAVPGKEGVFTDRKTLNYVYFNDHSITRYYKEGFIEEVPYNEDLIDAMEKIKKAQVPAES